MAATPVATARRRRHDDHEEGHDNAERWLLTYADMITLLMVLFIVLFALGQTDIRKFNAFKQSFHTTQIGPAPVLQGGTGVLSADNTVNLAPHIQPKDAAGPRPDQAAAAAPSAGAEAAQLAAAEAQMQHALDAAGLSPDVHLTLDSHHLTVTIATDKVLFAVGSAVLLPHGVAIIDAIAPTLAGIPNDLSIEGHTDNQPILPGGTYPSNWELSTARATAVLRYLIAAHGLAPDRLAAAGYADTRPLVPDDSPAHQAENRRVEVVVEASPTPPSS